MGGHPTVLVTGAGRQADRAREQVRSAHLSGASFASSTDGPVRAVHDLCLVAADRAEDVVPALGAARALAEKLVVLAPMTSTADLVAAVAAGADGWLAPDTAETGLVAAIEAVLRGESGFSRSATSHLVTELRRLTAESTGTTSPHLDPHGLTPREREIFEAQRAGRTVRQIAVELSLSEVTVRWHAGRATKKVEAIPLLTAPLVRAVPVVAPPAPKARATPGRGLSPAELRVALLVSEGLSNKQIAERLFISRHTVESHLKQAFAKLGVRSRVELTRLVLAEGSQTA